jgi:hypothetical protein
MMFPKISKLKRMEVEEVTAQADLAGLTAEVARDAEEELGYSHGTQAITLEEQKQKLLSYLRDLGIRPFVPEVVAEYMRAMARKTEQSWRTTALTNYDRPIPTFALHTALRIKREIPGAVLFVDALTFNVDPFLGVQLGQARYRIEVWDEPDFKTKRVV